MENINNKIEKLKLVPVVKLDRVEDALPLAKALEDGGLPVAEVTFRTDAAEESIRRISKAYPGMAVGAGTIINGEQARRAVGAGASFIVSPGFSDEVVDFALKNNVSIFPGICTPTEIMRAISYGLSVVKYFPANTMGGLKGIKSLAPVFPSLRFMPTGGINLDNMMEYLAYDRIIAVGGSWMVKSEFINARDFAKITSLTKEAVDKIKGM